MPADTLLHYGRGVHVHPVPDHHRSSAGHVPAQPHQLIRNISGIKNQYVFAAEGFTSAAFLRMP